MDTKHKKAVERTSSPDAIELLIADHRRVAKLFAEFNALNEEGSDEAKSALVARICEELIVHTAIEEEIFYPAVRKAIEDDDLMDEALVEHAGAKALIAQLQAAEPDDDLYDARVTVLGEQIDHHVEEEEGSLFPQARGSGIDTLSLGAALLRRKAELLAKLSMPPTTTTRVRGNDGAGRDRVKARPASASPKRSPRPKAQAAKKRASKKGR